MTSESGDEAAAIRAVRTAIDTWHRATSTGDVAGVLPLMAEDAIFLAPERAPMRGRAMFGRALLALLETHTIASNGEVREVVVSGSLAYSWTELTVTVTPLDGGAPTKRTGPALSIFSPAGGWRLAAGSRREHARLGRGPAGIEGRQPRTRAHGRRSGWLIGP